MDSVIDTHLMLAREYIDEKCLLFPSELRYLHFI